MVGISELDMGLLKSLCFILPQMSGFLSHRTQDLLFDYDLFCRIMYRSPYIKATIDGSALEF